MYSAVIERLTGTAGLSGSAGAADLTAGNALQRGVHLTDQIRIFPRSEPYCCLHKAETMFAVS